MPDYIDREELIRRIDMVTDTVGFPDHLTIKQIVSRVPAADVAPIVHGRWIKERRSALLDGGGIEVLSSCCPHCGVKMDLE